MGEIILTCANVALPTSLAQLAIPADAVMFLERLPDRWMNREEIADGIRLDIYDAAINLTQWERGRVFCEQWELRWEGERAIYTGAPALLTNFVAGPDLSQSVRQETSYYLWGKRQGQRFIELQVARILSYPVTAGNRVKLRVVEWFEDAGELIASRFIGLEEEE
jgi:hypothetical protein